MDKELLKRIDTLAAKLGVTADHIWRILLQQARIETIESATIALLALIAVCTCFYFIWWARTAEHSDHFKNEEYQVPIYVVCTIGGIIASVVLLSCAFSLPTTMFNPEYWALQKILKAL